MYHGYKWKKRDGWGKQKSMIDYTTVDLQLRKDVLDVQVVIGMYEESNHNVVLAKINVNGKWEYGTKIARGGE